MFFAFNFLIGSAISGSLKNGTFTLLDIIDTLQTAIFYMKNAALKNKKLLFSFIRLAIILALGYLFNDLIIHSRVFESLIFSHSGTMTPAKLSSILVNVLDTVVFTLFVYVLGYFAVILLKLQRKISLKEMLETIQLLEANNIDLQVSHDSEGRLRYNLTAILDNLYAAKDITNAIKWSAYNNIKDNYMEFKSLEILPYSIKWSDRLLLNLESTHKPI